MVSEWYLWRVAPHFSQLLASAGVHSDKCDFNSVLRPARLSLVGLAIDLNSVGVADRHPPDRAHVDGHRVAH